VESIGESLKRLLKGELIMAERDDLASIENLEVEPLTDEDLDSVAGGEVASNTCTCSNCATFTCPGTKDPTTTVITIEK
jgi:hypothetical protein